MARSHRQSNQSFGSLTSSPSLAGPGMGSTGNPAAAGQEEAPPMNQATPPNGPGRRGRAKCPKCGANLHIMAAPQPSTPMKGGGPNDNDGDEQQQMY